MSLDHLITDRTTQDVERVKALQAKAWQDMTEEEKVEWLSPLKGSYNYTDLNRVEEAVAYVAGRLKEYGYLPSLPDTRTWSVGDIPNASDFARYLGNVAALRRAIVVWKSTPKAPDSIDRFAITEANALEQILVDLNQLLNNMADTWFYSGDLYLGEVW